MWSTYLQSIKQQVNLTADQEAEIRGGVIREDLHRWAMEEKDRLIKDKGFRTRLLDGGRAESRSWNLLLAMLALRPVKPQ
jgi:hypothetical protein